jgi:hypothetical protein
MLNSVLTQHITHQVIKTSRWWCHACDPSTWEVEAKRIESSVPAWATQGVLGHLGLHSETLSQKLTNNSNKKIPPGGIFPLSFFLCSKLVMQS